MSRVKSYDVGKLLAALDDEQQQAVLAPTGPVIIVAGAGTGKTRTLTHRIAYRHVAGIAPASATLAVTHSAKAAGELRDRLASLGVPGAQTRTFHASALRQLSHFWKHTGLEGEAPILIRDSGPEGVYAILRHASSVLTGKHPSELSAEMMRDLRAEIAWAKARQIHPDDYAQQALRARRNVDSLTPSQVGVALDMYTRTLRQRGVLDFDDLLSECAKLLETNDHVAAQVQAAYREFVVDEYQDTDPAQQRLLDAWLGESRNICAVGDPRQTIYSFKGAEPSLLKTFTQRYAQAVRVELVKDYRSGEQVVSIANQIMRDTSAAGGATSELVGLGPSGPAPVVRAYEDETIEAEQVARSIQGLIAEGVRAGEIAVLVRFNSQCVPFASALAEVGIRTNTAGEEFYDRQEIVAALGHLGRLAGGEPNMDAGEALKQAAQKAGWDPKYQPQDAGAVSARHEALSVFVELHTTLTNHGVSGAASAFTELSRRRSEQHAPSSSESVAVMTIHKAKGLEWDVVFLPRLVQGSLPSAYASTPEQLDEERRLLYVACTRARRQLTASWARKRANSWRSEKSVFALLLQGRSEQDSAERRKKSHQGKAGRNKSGQSNAGRSMTGMGQAAQGTTGRIRGRIEHSAPVLRNYQQGCKVVHDKYGLGTVVAVLAGEKGNAIKIDFGSGGIRTMQASDPKLDLL